MNMIREYRVWSSSSDYVAGTEIYKTSNGWFTVRANPFSEVGGSTFTATTKRDRKRGFRSEYFAAQYAESLANDYMRDAVSDESERRKASILDIENEFHVQVVDSVENRDITAEQY
jgi:hypothetical protein